MGGRLAEVEVMTKGGEMKIILASIAVTVALIVPAMAEVSPSDIPPDVRAEIKARCVAKWQNHSDAYGMIAYCLERETEAWAEIQNF